LFAVVLAVSLMLVPAASVGASPGPGLVGLWHLDEGTGKTAYDSSGLGNDGTLSGGRFGGALSFDGVNDYVSVPDDASLDFGTGNFTIEAWIKVSGAAIVSNKEYGVVNKNTTFQFTPGWGIEVTTYSPATGADFGIVFLITQGKWANAAKVVKTSSMTADVWHHIAGVRNGTTIYVYFDGAEVGTKTHDDADDNVDNNQPVIIGGHSWGPPFPGLIDEVRISNVARTSFDLTSPPSADGNTVALWHFDEGSEQTAFDATANDNDGQLGSTTGIDANDPTWPNLPTWVPGKFGNALSFDGIDDYVQVPDDESLDLTTAITLEAWIKAPSGQTNGDRMVSKHRAYLIQYWNDRINAGVFTADGWGGSSWLSTVSIFDDSWHHVALTYDGSYMRLYIDGDLDTTKAWTGAILTNANDLSFGCRTPATDRFFTGTIDEVSIRDVALTPDAIDWLPPVTNADFTLKDGTTLPLKFQLLDDEEVVTSPQWVSLVITDPDETIIKTYMLGDGVENLRWNADEWYYIANLKTKVGDWPPGEYTATVDGIVTDTITFELSAEKGVGRGNSGK